MMKCINCGASCEQRMLHRTKPKGQPDMGLMCFPCIKNLHPELAANIKQDFVEEPVLGDLEQIFYGHNTAKE